MEEFFDNAIPLPLLQTHDVEATIEALKIIVFKTTPSSGIINPQKRYEALSRLLDTVLRGYLPGDAGFEKALGGMMTNGRVARNARAVIAKKKRDKKKKQ
jgi:hypothetical protein